MITIKIMPDDSAESPREWSNLGTMVCWHRQYKLGDVQPTGSPDEWIRENTTRGSIILPLWLYDHGGISMSVGGSVGWDSGQVGYIVATQDTIRKYFVRSRITRKMREQAEAILRSEVSTYDDFLRGNVWGFQIESTHDCASCGGKVHEPEIETSCWGFIGSDQSTLEDMQRHVPTEYHAAMAQAWENK